MNAQEILGWEESWDTGNAKSLGQVFGEYKVRGHWRSLGNGQGLYKVFLDKT